MVYEGECIDLHVHTTASDGSLSPVEAVRKAEKLGLAALAVTDHDTVDGVKEILAQGAAHNIDFVCGVEISAEIPPPFISGGSLHVLGYFINPYDPELDSSLKILQKARLDRNPRIVEKLRDMGMDVSMSQVEKISGGGQVGRPHIAQALVNSGAVANIREAFDLFLAKGKSAYVGKKRFSAQKAVELIRSAGGIAVCAHPFSLELGPRDLEKCMGVLKDFGIRGIEVIYPQHGPDLRAQYNELAGKFDLLVTGGTDFHGDSKPDIQMGFGAGDLRVPLSIYEKLKSAAKKSPRQSPLVKKWGLNKDLSELESEIRREFADKGLLAQALCHSSYANENPGLKLPHNERLEFLGDAVLNLIVGHMLMEKHGDAREGDLSRMRASLVNETQLADLARDIGLGSHLLLGRGETMAQGWEKNSILADCMEAVIAAVYLDGGFEAASVMVRDLYSPLLPERPSKAMAVDYKTRLQEYSQSELKATPSYSMVDESGPDHEKTFEVKVLVTPDIEAGGRGRSKKAAQQDAARAALLLLGQK